MRLPSTVALSIAVLAAVYAPTAFAAEPVMRINAPLSRAAFVQLVIDHLYTQEQIDGCFWDIASSTPPTFTLLYSDVPVTASYAKQVCVAFRDGFARGYKDGSFRPNQEVTFAEASKIIARANHLMPYADAEMQLPWYRSYAESLAKRNAIPFSVASLNASITYDQTVDILNRLDTPTMPQESLTYEDLVRRTWPVEAPKPVVKAAGTPRVSPLKPITTPSNTSSSSSSMPMSASSSSAAALPWYKLF